MLPLIALFPGLYPWAAISDHPAALQASSKLVYDRLAASPTPWEIFGQSTAGHNIYYLQVGSGSDTTVIFGAFHGDEQAGFHLVTRLADTLIAHPQIIRSVAILVPVVNPDGLLSHTRLNANGVDINRNFPTENWSSPSGRRKAQRGPTPGSEKETRLVMQMIDTFHPARIITIHDDLHMNNYDGPAEQLARLMETYNHYPVTTAVGYATPGSFGTYAGIERHIPTITLELPAIGPDQAWRENRLALLAAINFQNDE